MTEFAIKIQNKMKKESPFADGSSWIIFFYEDSLQQRAMTDDSTVFVPIQTGGGIEIRTLAGI